MDRYTASREPEFELLMRGWPCTSRAHREIYLLGNTEVEDIDNRFGGGFGEPQNYTTTDPQGTDPSSAYSHQLRSLENGELELFIDCGELGPLLRAVLLLFSGKRPRGQAAIAPVEREV
jgi:hypothetical protein